MAVGGRVSLGITRHIGAWNAPTVGRCIAQHPEYRRLERTDRWSMHRAAPGISAPGTHRPLVGASRSILNIGAW